jgi:N-acetylmuramoyl-L-alanine amidase
MMRGCLAAAMLTASVLAAAAAESARAAPKRPVAALPTTRIGPIGYVSLTDVARHLGLQGHWSGDQERYSLTRNGLRLDFVRNGRDLHVNGYRIHLGDPVTWRRGRLYLSQTDWGHTVRPIVRPGEIGAVPPLPRLIFLDPGHGGSDPGTMNPKLKLMEKTITLQVARRTRERLEAAGYRVRLTRERDRLLGHQGAEDFRRRAHLANAANADLFISIHFNADGDPRTRGAETFVFTPAGQRSTESWSTGQLDIEKSPVPVNKYDGWSAVLAHAVQGAVAKRLQTPDRGQKTKHAAVLRWVDCPAVLVESAFISNPTDAHRVVTAAYQEKIAAAIAAGVDGYVAQIRALRPKS